MCVVACKDRGNPRGALDQKLPPVTLKNDWVMGPPDVALPLPSEFAFAADKMEDTSELTIQSGTKDVRWLRAVDLLPGTPSIVRSAIIYVKPRNDVKETAGNTPEPEHILARWVPGHDPEPIGNGLAHRLPAGAELGVRIHYKKTWQFEAKAMSDRSTIGLYFAPAPGAQELLALPIASPPLPAAGGSDQKVAFSQTLAEDVQALDLAGAPRRVGQHVQGRHAEAVGDATHLLQGAGPVVRQVAAVQVRKAPRKG